MTAHHSQSLLVSDVPQLDDASVSSDCKVTALLGPLYGRDGVALVLSLHQFRDGSRGSVPQENSVCQTDGNHVLSRPVNEVQVIVVSQARGIQNLFRILRNVAGRLLDGSSVAGFVAAVQYFMWVVVFTRSWGLVLEGKDLVIFHFSLEDGIIQRCLVQVLSGRGAESRIHHAVLGIVVFLAHVEGAKAKIHGTSCRNESVTLMNPSVKDRLRECAYP